MLEGDRYEFDWEAEEGAHLSLTNQGFTKVHPGSPEKGSSMASRFLLAPNACIENMMKPIMLYKDASFENETTVNLGVGAVWMQGKCCAREGLRVERASFTANWITGLRFTMKGS